MRECEHKPEVYRKLMTMLEAEMARGLTKSGKSKLKMLVTYVHGLPDGTGNQEPLSLSSLL